MHRTIYAFVRRRRVLRAAKRSDNLKLNMGCGNNHQKGYVNVDVRRLSSVDLVATPKDCLRLFPGRCEEVYISHVLEHFESPGKDRRKHDESVLGFLAILHGMLKPSGLLRVAVPDFRAIAKLYTEGRFPLYPRLLGRLCGEQSYPGNLHKCMFDREYLEQCLRESGFTNIRDWDPAALGLNRDSSFDELDGVRTSLNLVADKI